MIRRRETCLRQQILDVADWGKGDASREPAIHITPYVSMERMDTFQVSGQRTTATSIWSRVTSHIHR